VQIPILFCALAAAAYGAGVQLHLQYGAIQKALSQQMFRSEGRMYVKGTPQSRCNFAYLENPVIGGRDGRIEILARFTGRNSFNLLGLCLGMGDSFDMRILTEPHYEKGAIRLKDVRVETIQRETYYSRRVREAIREKLPVQFEYRVDEEARKILERKTPDAPYQQKLSGFQVSRIDVTPEALILTLEFTLVVK
jgi:hypothetical protein